jgi:hypothetical protein
VTEWNNNEYDINDDLPSDNVNDIDHEKTDIQEADYIPIATHDESNDENNVIDNDSGYIMII